MYYQRTAAFIDILSISSKSKIHAYAAEEHAKRIIKKLEMCTRKMRNAY